LAEKHLKESLELELIKKCKNATERMNDPYHFCGFCFWMKINLASTVCIPFSSKLAVDFRVRMAFLSGEKKSCIIYRRLKI